MSGISVCFCTLAIHAPYRERARQLCADATGVPWVVLTDEPSEFADLPVRAIRHIPTGPMAIDYRQRLGPTGNSQGAAAYHDKRFALQAALVDFNTAIFLDADSRIVAPPPLDPFPAGLAVIPLIQKSIAAHLEACGSWRLPAFEEAARILMGHAGALHSARWCHETPLAVTKDGNEHRFFKAWGEGAGILQRREQFSGEGGIIGLAAAYAGWTVNDNALARLASVVQHEGGGPKG